MSRLIATAFAALCLTACGDPTPVTPCDRAAQRVELVSTSEAAQPLAPIKGGGARGKLFLSWQGEEGPEVCEPAETPECGVADDGCTLPMRDVVVGERASRELFFVNISPGNVALHIVDFAYDACPDLSVSAFEALVLPPDAVTSVEVTFAPTIAGACAGVLEVYSDALNVDTGLPTLVSVEASGVAR